jgi:hypothetical protein
VELLTRARLQSMAAAAACLGMLISPTATAAPAGHAGAVIDVALGEGGVLAGQVVDAQGAPLAGTAVSVRSGGRDVLQAATNERGEFATAGLKGGVYEVVAGQHRGVYRLWAPRTAPPSANRAIMVVSGEVVRAQYSPPSPQAVLQTPIPGYIETVPYGPAPGPMGPAGPGPMKKSVHWMKNHPWITAGVIARAIAVPVSVSEFDDDPAS